MVREAGILDRQPPGTAAAQRPAGERQPPGEPEQITILSASVETPRTRPR
jgi:hypothetical protein